MRLTHYIRSQIERNVLSELPKEKDVKYYQDLTKVIVEKCAIKKLPAELQSVALDPKINGYLTRFYFYIQEFGFSVCIFHGGEKPFKLDDESLKSITELHKEFVSIHEAKHKATLELRAALNSCSTVKTLRERYPELVKYFPDSVSPAASTPNVPVVQNPLKAFKSLGLSMSE